ncbi:MAG TPA: hypothetical protein VHE80_08315 [Acidimicrobiales bacterium]|nr:hypothetical protein [Acidimicrobiales bacterium]
MASYALASGLRVPTSVLQTLEALGAAEPAGQGPASAGPSSGGEGDGSPSSESLRRLVLAHDQLAQIVAPATPRTLLLLHSEAEHASFWSFLGPVRLIRQMVVLGIISLLVFIFTALSPEVNTTSGDIFRSSGMSLLINEVFLLSAAGVGAAFAALFSANRYISNGTYDPKYESSYWIRFILGLIAGMVLAVLVPIDASSKSFTRPLLALLGGFSASVVYRILQRLVDTLESLVQGDTRDLAAARENILRAQVEEQRMQERLRMSSSLLELREKVVGEAGVSDATKAKLAAMITDLAPIEGLAEAEASAAALTSGKSEERAQPPAGVSATGG